MHYLHIHAPGNSDISLGQITDATVTIAKALEMIGIESDIEISAGACCGVVTIGLSNAAWDEIYEYDAETNQKQMNS